MKYVRWTNKQIVWLKENWATKTKQEIVAHLGPHPWGSIRRYAEEMKLKKNQNPDENQAAWREYTRQYLILRGGKLLYNMPVCNDGGLGEPPSRTSRRR